MEDKRYAILYSSKTGNTQKLAETIHAALGEENCAYIGNGAGVSVQAKRLYIGFWTDKGTADAETFELLKTLKNKEIFLFGTAGFGGDVSYFDKILTAVKANIDESNTMIGAYMCQGKMPMTVRARYEKMKQEANAMPNVDMLIENFDKALTHPDADDLQKLCALVQNEK